MSANSSNSVSGASAPRLPVTLVPLQKPTLWQKISLIAKVIFAFFKSIFSGCFSCCRSRSIVNQTEIIQLIEKGKRADAIQEAERQKKLRSALSSLPVSAPPTVVVVEQQQERKYEAERKALIDQQVVSQSIVEQEQKLRGLQESQPPFIQNLILISQLFGASLLTDVKPDSIGSKLAAALRAIPIVEISKFLQESFPSLMARFEDVFAEILLNEQGNVSAFDLLKSKGIDLLLLVKSTAASKQQDPEQMVEYVKKLFELFIGEHSQNLKLLIRTVCSLGWAQITPDADRLKAFRTAVQGSVEASYKESNSKLDQKECNDALESQLKLLDELSTSEAGWEKHLAIWWSAENRCDRPCYRRVRRALLQHLCLAAVPVAERLQTEGQALIRSMSHDLCAVATRILSKRLLNALPVAPSVKKASAGLFDSVVTAIDRQIVAQDVSWKAAVKNKAKQPEAIVSNMLEVFTTQTICHPVVQQHILPTHPENLQDPYLLFSRGLVNDVQKLFAPDIQGKQGIQILFEEVMESPEIQLWLTRLTALLPATVVKDVKNKLIEEISKKVIAPFVQDTLKGYLEKVVSKIATFLPGAVEKNFIDAKANQLLFPSLIALLQEIEMKQLVSARADALAELYLKGDKTPESWMKVCLDGKVLDSKLEKALQREMVGLLTAIDKDEALKKLLLDSKQVALSIRQRLSGGSGGPEEPYSKKELTVWSDFFLHLVFDYGELNVLAGIGRTIFKQDFVKDSLAGLILSSLHPFRSSLEASLAEASLAFRESSLVTALEADRKVEQEKEETLEVNMKEIARSLHSIILLSSDSWFVSKVLTVDKVEKVVAQIYNNLTGHTILNLNLLFQIKDLFFSSLKAPS
jgi:hypothetical protein